MSASDIPQAALRPRAPHRARLGGSAARPAAARLHLLRRRHAEPDGPGHGRRPDRGCASACSIPAPISRSRSRPTRPASRRAKLRAFRDAGVNRVSLGIQSLDPAALRLLGREHSAPQAHSRARTGAGDLPARVVRPDLRPAGPGHRGLAGRAGPGARPVRRPSLALPAHHRARHAVRGAASPRRAGVCRTTTWPPRSTRRPQVGCAAAWAAGLRGQQPRAARRREPAQPGLLALCRLRRHRARRAWPGHAGQAA